MELFNAEKLNQIRDILLQKKETVAVAESVTSGFIQLALSQPPNATEFFEGGLTAFNLGQKARHLEVSPILADSCDSVSEEVAAQMAMKINKSFMSTYGISITGYATCVPQKNINSLYAYVAISYRGEIVHSEKIIADKKDEGLVCQLYYTQKIIAIFLNHLKK
jgi:PncC family amidohydrolase